jgi:hypothetical protein
VCEPETQHVDGRTCAKGMLGVYRVGGDGMVMMAEHDNQGDLVPAVTGRRSQSVRRSDESR